MPGSLGFTYTCCWRHLWLFRGGIGAPSHLQSALRFANAERLFREEANLMGDSVAEPPADPGVFQDLVLFNVADGDTRRFVEEFDRLAAWIDSSLDLYKVQLQ